MFGLFGCSKVKKELEEELGKKTFELSVSQIHYLKYKNAYFLLLDQWNILIEKINARGGTTFLETGNGVFTQDEINTLINLCHPDKHGGKKSATDMTQKLLSLRR